MVKDHPRSTIELHVMTGLRVFDLDDILFFFFRHAATSAFPNRALLVPNLGVDPPTAKYSAAAHRPPTATRPSFTTTAGRSITEISVSGSPFTATRSAR